MRYRYGIIFNFERQLRMSDPTHVFREVNHRWFLIEIVNFLTEDVGDGPQGFERCNEIEYLMNLLCDRGIIADHVFHQDEPYIKICGILFSICEAMVEMFVDTRFFDNLQGRENWKHRKTPMVFDNSNGSYSILLDPY